ncbi:DUF2079 domain-containing protein [Streptacidiphilus sp. MAP5-3]|uniref:DUF2079 domain-containing protein n=1 Tax=unclassified Streptacidiphilus TaxID=2643834 RepID=UPI0035176008
MSTGAANTSASDISNTTGTSTAPIGVPAQRMHRRIVPKRSTWPYLLLGLVFLVGYSVIEISRYTHFASMSWDLAIFEEEVKQYAHFQAPIVHIKGAHANILGDHFSPIMALLAPLWWIWPSGVMLLLAQSALFASSVTIVAATAGRFVSRTKALCLGFGYGLSWGMQRAVDFDFHEIAFAVPILAVVLRNMLLKRWHRAAFWALPLTLVKEDLGFTVVAIGVVLFLLRQRALGALLAVFGAGMALLTVYAVIPHFSATGSYGYDNKLPSGSWTGWVTGFLSPADVKLTTLAFLLGVTGFLALRSPLVLIAVPTLGWRFVSVNPDYWGQDWHYNAVLMPILFLALVDAIRRMEERGGARGGERGEDPTEARTPKRGTAAPEWLRGYAARGVVPAVTAVSIALCATMTLPAKQIFMPSTYRSTDHTDLIGQALAEVPNGTTVECNITPMAHLAARTDVYWLGGSQASPPQYIVLDLSYGWAPSPPSDLPGYAAQLHPGATYRILFDQQQFAVLQLVT